MEQRNRADLYRSEKGRIGMNEHDEQAAWSCFAQTGRVQDYLIYSQCKQQNAVLQEEPDGNQYGRPGDYGAAGG